MKRVVSYGCKIIKIPSADNRIFDKTIDIYKEALSFIIAVANQEWKDIECIDTLKYKEHYVESLIHKTKRNPSPKYNEFDSKFYKFPSYLRRSAIDEAIGVVSSYRSNLKNYNQQRYHAISNGKKFNKKP